MSEALKQDYVSRVSETVNSALACLEMGPRTKEKGRVTSVQKHLLSAYCLQNHGLAPG